MVFEETESHLIIGILYLLRPEVIVIVMAAETRHTNTYGILRSRDMTVLTLGIVLKAEHKTSKHLGVHLWEFHRPYLLDHVACRCRQTTTVAHLKGRLKGYCYCPTGMKHRHIRLVDPCASQVKTCRYATAITL